MNFFTSDTHFGHYLPALKRPFIGYEMDELMVKNWNNSVKSGDDVWFLGDFCLHTPESVMKILFSRLNGNKHLLKGNHDQNNKVTKLPWGSVHDVHMFKMPDSYNLNASIPGIWLSHYPHRSWPQSFHGSLHLHGHSHGHLPPYVNSLDVGVDCHNFKPLSLDEVLVLIPRGELKS